MTLPPLPEPGHRGPTGTGTYFDAFTADQLRDYARAAIAAHVPAVLAAVPAQPVAFRVRLDGMWFHGASREGLIAAIGVKLGRSIAEQEVEPLYAAPQAVPVLAGGAA